MCDCTTPKHHEMEDRCCAGAPVRPLKLADVDAYVIVDLHIPRCSTKQLRFQGWIWPEGWPSI